MNIALSLPMRSHSRVSARLILLLLCSSGLLLSAILGVAICYGWHSLHNPPVIKKVDVPHTTKQPWRNINTQLTFNVTPLPVETEEPVEDAEAEVQEPVADTVTERIAQDDTYPLLDALPESLRRRLPEVKYEAHIYSSETGKSVINLNGKDYGEGAVISGGVQVVKIEPDSALFSFEGHTFRVTALADW